MDYGQMKLHIRDVLFSGNNTHFIRPTLVIRQGLFQVISGLEIKQDDVNVITVTKFELENGFLGNRWDTITQAAMGSWKDYSNVKKPKNPKQ